MAKHECEACGNSLERPGQKHGCLKGNHETQRTFPSLRNPLPKDYVETKIAEYERRCEHEAQMLGAAIWMWLREQLERWSEEHKPEAHMLFRQGNGVEVLWVDDVMIELWWSDDRLEKDDERRFYFPLVAIMEKLETAVCAEENRGVPVNDLELRAGKLVVEVKEG